MDDDPNWIQVLEVMYDEGDFQTLDSLLNNYDFDFKLTEEQSKKGVDDIFDTELQTTGILLIIALQNLNKIGLITRFDKKDDKRGTNFKPDTRFMLTESGFQVIHDRKLQERQREVLDQTNKAYWIIAFLTVILAIGEAISAAAAFGYAG